jgi:hypothetical protein
MKFLLDSVIFIDHFNSVPAATAYLRRAHGDSLISVVTRAEVLTGFGPRDLPAVLPLMNRFPTLVLDQEAADLAARLRRQYRWKLPDAFQAALAQIHRLKLVTRNARDFPPQRFNFVVVPYKVRPA